MKVSGQLYALPTLCPGKEVPWYELDRRLGMSQSWTGRCGEEKNLASAGNGTQVVQPIACRYTDWAIQTST
jgi:hypothetical protein